MQQGSIYSCKKLNDLEKNDSFKNYSKLKFVQVLSDAFYNFSYFIRIIAILQQINILPKFAKIAKNLFYGFEPLFSNKV